MVGDNQNPQSLLTSVTIIAELILYTTGLHTYSWCIDSILSYNFWKRPLTGKAVGGPQFRERMIAKF